MEVVSISLINTVNFLGLQETTPSPLECIKTVGFYPYLYLEILGYILSFLRSFGQKHWQLLRKTSKKFQPPLPILWFFWDLDTLNHVNYDVRPDCCKFDPNFKSTAAKTSSGDVLNNLTFLRGKMFSFLTLL